MIFNKFSLDHIYNGYFTIIFNNADIVSHDSQTDYQDILFTLFDSNTNELVTSLQNNFFKPLNKLIFTIPVVNEFDNAPAKCSLFDSAPWINTLCYYRGLKNTLFTDSLKTLINNPLSSWTISLTLKTNKNHVNEIHKALIQFNDILMQNCQTKLTCVKIFHYQHNSYDELVLLVSNDSNPIFYGHVTGLITKKEEIPMLNPAVADIGSIVNDVQYAELDTHLLNVNYEQLTKQIISLDPQVNFINAINKVISKVKSNPLYCNLKHYLYKDPNSNLDSFNNFSFNLDFYQMVQLASFIDDKYLSINKFANNEYSRLSDDPNILKSQQVKLQKFKDQYPDVLNYLSQFI